jgi:hypothetical protein
MSEQVYGTRLPARPAQRPQLQRRLNRLVDMTPAISAATTALAALPGADKMSEVRIRHEFVWSRQPAPAQLASDRKAPPVAQRPPVTALMSATGITLKLYLVALFDAQARARDNGVIPTNPHPITATDQTGRPGWTDLITTEATDPDAGDWSISALEKRGRSIRGALNTLHDADLILLPNGDQPSGKHERFRIKHEGGRPATGENRRYRVPQKAFFTVPTQLFTHGWIHVLNDTEIAFLLILSFWQQQNPGQRFRIPTSDRLRRHGLGRDAYSDSTRVLADLKIAEAEADPQVQRASRAGVGNRFYSLPHLFQLVPTGLDQDADTAMITYLRDILRQPRAGR